jgi:hypothetical protein
MAAAHSGRRAGVWGGKESGIHAADAKDTRPTPRTRGRRQARLLNRLPSPPPFLRPPLAGHSRRGGTDPPALERMLVQVASLAVLPVTEAEAEAATETDKGLQAVEIQLWDLIRLAT